MDPKEIVANGYDHIAERYAEWVSTVRVAERARYTRDFLNALRDGAEVLELGCGNGVPTTRELTSRYRVTGVDISSRQIALARANVPQAEFCVADMTQLDFSRGSFDGITAFYAITHVPRDQHATLLHSIADFLRPGGLFMASMGAESAPGCTEDDWLGAPMYFSHFDAGTNQSLIEDAGLNIESSRVETADEDGIPIPFLWVVARKPHTER